MHWRIRERSSENSARLRLVGVSSSPSFSLLISSKHRLIGVRGSELLFTKSWLWYGAELVRSSNERGELTAWSSLEERFIHSRSSLSMTSFSGKTYGLVSSNWSSRPRFASNIASKTSSWTRSLADVIHRSQIGHSLSLQAKKDYRRLSWNQSSGEEVRTDRSKHWAWVHRIPFTGCLISFWLNGHRSRTLSSNMCTAPPNLEILVRMKERAGTVVVLGLGELFEPFKGLSWCLSCVVFDLPCKPWWFLCSVDDHIFEPHR